MDIVTIVWDVVTVVWDVVTIVWDVVTVVRDVMTIVRDVFTHCDPHSESAYCVFYLPGCLFVLQGGVQ